MACWWLEHSRWLVRAVIRRSLRPPLQLHPQAAEDSSLNGRKNNCARCHVPIPCSLHGNVKDWKNIWVFFAKLRAGLPGIWDAITTRTPLRALCQGLGLSGVPTRGWPWVRGWWCPGPWRRGTWNAWRFSRYWTPWRKVNSKRYGTFRTVGVGEPATICSRSTSWTSTCQKLHFPRDVQSLCSFMAAAGFEGTGEPTVTSSLRTTRIFLWRWLCTIMEPTGTWAVRSPSQESRVLWFRIASAALVSPGYSWSFSLLC